MNNVILVGNPNVGKTTLFNTLTKSNEKANNWHGVTVDVKNRECKINDTKIIVSDIPGMYSLDGYSNEERIASNYLKSHKNDLIVNICDASTLKKNLKLTYKLLEESYNVIVAVNMINEVKGVDLEGLQKLLGVKVVGIDARNINGIKSLKDAIFDWCCNDELINSPVIKNGIDVKKIDELIFKINKTISYKTSNVIDKFLLNKFLFIPIFLSVVFLIFYLTFGEFGIYFSKIFNKAFEVVFDRIKNMIININFSPIVKDFLMLGIINSIEIVLGFVPQILLLMMLVNILEDTGFMSRVAFMFDGLLRRFGLTGKSLFSILMGYGCTTTAVLTTRNLEKQSLRKRTALILPFSICSAKLPIFLTIASLFFEDKKYLFVFLLYVFSVVLILLFSFILKKVIPDNENVFILEMPKYRLPYLKKVIKDAFSVLSDFFIKIGSTIIFAGAIFWLLQNFSFTDGYLNGQNIHSSILFVVSNKLSTIFNPIGLGQAGIVAVLLFGLIAKELIVLGLSLVNGVPASMELLCGSLISQTSVCYFTRTTSLVFLMFILLYSPCFSAIFTIKNEFGKKTAGFVFVFQFIISYLICLILYKILTINYDVNIILFCIFIFVAIIVFIMIKSMKKNICKGNCNACRKI